MVRNKTRVSQRPLDVQSSLSHRRVGNLVIHKRLSDAVVAISDSAPNGRDASPESLSPSSLPRPPPHSKPSGILDMAVRSPRLDVHI